MIRATLANTSSPGRPPTPPRSRWVPVSRAQLCKAPWRPDMRLHPGIPGGLRGRLECGASVCTEVAALKGGAGQPGGEPCLQSGRLRRRELIICTETAVVCGICVHNLEAATMSFSR
ncbi:unnamed protein product [Rangifer tarandus platyrhynchus]|uniref:Uncharacterized protein n=1 Tax=Rangifer tarandus platyrhynchus TaxID=3082113 RepID=A0ABN9A1E8_RANTA|nr:unnamed protein product [Rangifer tarandus platyrhynchus]